MEARALCAERYVFYLHLVKNISKTKDKSLRRSFLFKFTELFKLVKCVDLFPKFGFLLVDGCHTTSDDLVL